MAMTKHASTIRQALLVSVFAAGLGGAAWAQGGAQQGTTAQQVNPSPMTPGSRAGDAPGMNSAGSGNTTAPGTTAQQVNPSPIPPGSRANEAPGLNPAARQTQGRAPDSGVPGGIGANAPSGQPDVARGTAPATQSAQTRDPGAAPGGTTTPGTMAPGATGATTPTIGGAQGGGTNDTTPPAATTQHTQPRTAAAPVAGANSFTEGQARARMSDAGFNDVQDLRLDDQGIWRGRGMRNGQQTGVALDFQGNVVGTPQ